jgi:hypothetical protein
VCVPHFRLPYALDTASSADRRPRIAERASGISIATKSIARPQSIEAAASNAVYRPRFLGHRVEAYAARAAAESCSSLTAAGGLKPCRSISHVAL